MSKHFLGPYEVVHTYMCSLWLLHEVENFEPNTTILILESFNQCSAWSSGKLLWEYLMPGILLIVWMSLHVVRYFLWCMFGRNQIRINTNERYFFSIYFEKYLTTNLRRGLYMDNQEDLYFNKFRTVNLLWNYIWIIKIISCSYNNLKWSYVVIL